MSAERSLGNQVGQTDPELNPGSNLGPNPGLGAVPNSERNHAHLQRRTLGVLSAANALGAIGMTIGVATASLLAKEVSGRESLAGLAQTFQTIGAAGAAYFLAQVADRRGRRIGLSLGFLIGAAGSALMVLAAGLGSMTLLLMGALMLGSVSATGLAARYAATDLATAETRARSLAIVVWMTTIGAVLGPNLSSWSQRLGPILGVPELAGSFALGALAMLAGAAVAWLWLRPDPLLVARAAETHAVAPQPGARESAWVKALRAARADYRLAAAILALGAAHAVMVSVMIMTPLHMEHGQATLRIIGLVISVHIVGMFLFAPLVGWACDRWGRSSTLGLGGGVLLLSLAIAGTAPEGHSFQITIGLFLLGLGWSMATVSASALIVDLTPAGLRTDVQGVADLFMQSLAAVGGALSGVVVGWSGYPTLALGAVIPAGLVLVAAWQTRAKTLQTPH